MAKKKEKPEKNIEEEKIPSEEEITTDDEQKSSDSAEQDFSTVVMEPEELELTTEGEISPVKESVFDAPTIKAVPEDFDEEAAAGPEITKDDEISEGEEVPADLESEIEMFSDEAVEPPPKPPGRRALWLEFPRRFLLSLIAFGAALGILEILKLLIENTTGRGFNWSKTIDITGTLLNNTHSLLNASLLVLITTYVIALLLGLILASLAVLNHTYVSGFFGPIGSLLKSIGRFVMFPLNAGGLLLIAPLAAFLVIGQMELFEIGMSRLIPQSSFWFPAVVLALLPALLTAQTLAKSLTLPNIKRNFRTWALELLKALANLFDMIGGILSGLIVVEFILKFNGLGSLMAFSVSYRDFPTAVSILQYFALLVLIHRILANLLRWIYRMLSKDATKSTLDDSLLDDLPADEIPVEPAAASNFQKFIENRWGGIARIIWVIFAVIFLAVPIGIFLYGITQTSSNDIFNEAASAGSSNILVALASGLICVVLSLIFGAASGWLKNNGKLWSESLSDLLLLPSDIGLMLPLVPFAMVLMEWLMSYGNRGEAVITREILPDNGMTLTVIIIGFLLAARGVRFARSLWLAAPSDAGRVKKVIYAVPYLFGFFFAAAFASFWYETILSFMREGIRDYEISLGKLLSYNISLTDPADMVVVGVIITLVLFSFYMLADALIGFFNSKEPISKLFE